MAGPEILHGHASAAGTDPDVATGHQFVAERQGQLRIAPHFHRGPKGNTAAGIGAFQHLQSQLGHARTVASPPVRPPRTGYSDLVAGGRRIRKPQGRVGRWFERVALGAIMGTVVFVVERRLTKRIRKRDDPPQGADRSRTVELGPATEQVEQQP